ncbi:class III extradiol ring-cleavage dioxygenase family protein [Phycicoccus flavus]|uniref:hypothetical protein n=1 Tax=Phycicoccus flavus TaxID=2502783 RepID=UPI000FEBB787|nr:hypothetical protein [Phycicoccus flavus]NHA66513.1 hypothetical protein [Phycicoccus flavus]
MSGSLVVVPGAPLLLPEYTGRADAGSALRERAVQAIGAATDLDGTDRVVLVVATDREQRGTRSPLGQRVGSHLCGLAGVGVDGVLVVAWDAPVAECRALGEHLAGRPAVTLVAVADGSARRGEKAPGHLDPRAVVFDDDLVAALRAADPAALLDLDPALAAELLAHGRAPLQVAAAALAGRGGLHCADLETADPFGVLYVVARLSAA